MISAIRTFLIDESGATAIEYGLIAALISIAAIAAMDSMGDTLQTLFGSIAGDVDGAVGGSSGGNGDNFPKLGGGPQVQ